MIKAIINKEWLKLKFYLVSLLLICLGVFGYFFYNLDFSFSTTEPESMMWYRFAHLEQKSYYLFSYLFLIIATVVSFAQFLPEKIKNRIKIIAHLPAPLYKSISMHFVIGLFMITLLSLILTTLVGYVVYDYYTDEIFGVMLKDFSFYLLGSYIFYMALSSAIIEESRFLSALKLLFGVFTIFIYFKNRYYAYDMLWVFIFCLFFCMALDSFYSIKKQRLKHPVYVIGMLVGIVFIFLQANTLYQDKYKKTFNRYYIFYSPIIKDFVYQKNFGDHRFEYGVKDKKTFDRIEYESYLPFVYWRNLDIQKKLPIVIDGVNYDKKNIKKSRLSFSYSAPLLKTKEVNLYPLLNPNSSLGMIKFPEHMLQFNSLHVKAYNYDEGFNSKLSSEINSLFETHDLKMPITHVWGKTTNMKPYDLGYLMLDSKNRLFNLKRKDGVVRLKEIIYPAGIELVYVKISENKQKKIAGYAIDSDSNFYILDWNLNFTKVELDGFNYKTMKLQFISNVLYYLIRYDDGKNYNAIAFTKDLNKIKKIEIN